MTSYPVESWMVVDDDLSLEDLRSIRTIAFAMNEFEPFPAAILPRRALDRLTEAGLAEEGRSCRPAVGSTGYRLTEEGWRIARERWTRR